VRFALPILASLLFAAGTATPAHAAMPQDSAHAVAAPATVSAPVADEHAEHAAMAAQEQAAAVPAPVDIITPHITDSHYLDVPYWKAPFVKEIELPRWAPIDMGPLGLVDMSPTKHVVMLLLAAFLSALTLVTAASAHRRHHHEVGRPKGFAAGIEAMVLYLRNEVVLPNVGHHGEKFVPFALTLFFFILFANLLGLIPYGSTATGNISVTATLAIITFIVIEIAGMRAQGLGYLNTLFYWNNDLPIVMRIIMFFVMSPVEMAGKLARPFALAIRLFANMTAGHIVVLALIGLIFTFKSLASGAPFLMAIGIMMLELFVSFLQAYIFTLLASVFIGQVRESHH
jgi:F-type H+-transporting ATPase subunit a